MHRLGGSGGTLDLFSALGRPGPESVRKIPVGNKLSQAPMRDGEDYQDPKFNAPWIPHALSRSKSRASNKYRAAGNNGSWLEL